MTVFWAPFCALVVNLAGCQGELDNSSPFLPILNLQVGTVG